MSEAEMDLSGDLSQHYLLFAIADLRMALPLMSVIKTGHALPVTRLPFVEAHVEGLVNFEGAIIPQIDLGRYIYPDALSTGKKIMSGTEIIVVEIHRSRFSLRVDAVLDHIKVSDENLAGQNISILDVSPFADLVIHAPAMSPVAGENRLGAHHSGVHRQEKEYSCLVIHAAQQRYAFMLDDVREMHPVLPVTWIPGTPLCISGVTQVRDKSRLVIDFACLLKQEAGQVANYQSMISMDISNNTYTLALTSGIEFMSFRESDIKPLENTYGQFSRQVVDGAGEVTILIDPQTLIPAFMYEEIATFSPAQEITREVIEHTTRLLQIRLADRNYGIPLDKVRRVFSSRPPAKLNDKREIITGMLDVDGKVVPVLNACKLFDLSLSRSISLSKSVAHDNLYVALTHDNREWIMPVQRVSDVIEIADSRIDRIDGSSAACIDGYCRHKGEILPIVSVEKIYARL